MSERKVMQDMLGQDINDGDLIMFSGSVLKVIRSTRTRLKYTNGNYEAGTSQSHQILKLSDFDPSKIQEMIDSIPEERKEQFDRYQPQIAEKTLMTEEQKLEAAAERKKRNEMKKKTKLFSLIADGHNNSFVYIGKHRDPSDNVMKHCYISTGYLWYTDDSRVQEHVNQIMNTDGRGWYRGFGLNYVKSMKTPDRIFNQHTEVLGNYFKTLTGDENTSTAYAEHYARIREMCNI